MQNALTQQTPAPEGCNGCAIYLMRLCAQRRWWFSLIREPLAFAMRLLARLHSIPVPPQSLQTQNCEQCMKPMKMALLKKSALFRFGSNILSPWFGKLRLSLVTQDEIAKAKQLAHQSDTKVIR